MSLLTNQSYRRMMRDNMTTAYISVAAIHGPYSRHKRTPMERFVSFLIALALAASIATLCLDLLVWRP